MTLNFHRLSFGEWVDWISFFLLKFRTPYAKNPFDSVSDQEIEEYKRQVEMSQKGISGKCFLLSSSQQPSSRKRSSTWWSFGITEEHEVSYSTTEAPTMEPLVAESVILSASGEPVRPERKAQSPTSPRPHASDDEGTFLFHCLTSNRVYLYSPPRVVNLMVSGNSLFDSTSCCWFFIFLFFFSCWFFSSSFFLQFEMSLLFLFDFVFLCFFSVLVYRAILVE